MNNNPYEQPDEMLRLTLQANQAVRMFADYIKTLDPELLDIEALALAVKFVELLPELCGCNPNVIAQIHDGCCAIKKHRALLNEAWKN
jgi:hypothetical protein